MKYNYKISLGILVILIIIIFQSCREYEIIKIIKVSTGEITEIMTNSATAKGEIAEVVGEAIQYGHCWSTLQTPTIHDKITILFAEKISGIFTSSLTGLLPGTTYYIRAYAFEVKDENRDGLDEGVGNGEYGAIKSVTTEVQTLPAVVTGNVSERTPGSPARALLVNNSKSYN